MSMESAKDPADLGALLFGIVRAMLEMMGRCEPSANIAIAEASRWQAEGVENLAGPNGILDGCQNSHPRAASRLLPTNGRITVTVKPGIGAYTRFRTLAAVPWLHVRNQEKRFAREHFAFARQEKRFPRERFAFARQEKRFPREHFAFARQEKR